MKTIEKIFDASTGETTVVERDMTPEEIVNYELAQAELQKQFQLKQEILAKRQALLDKLGITEDEARLLLGGN